MEPSKISYHSGRNKAAVVVTRQMVAIWGLRAVLDELRACLKDLRAEAIEAKGGKQKNKGAKI